MAVKVFVILDPHTGSYLGRKPGGQGLEWVRDPKCFLMFVERALADQQARKLKKPGLYVTEAECEATPEGLNCILPDVARN